MPSGINSPNVRDGRSKDKGLSNKEYNKFFYDYDFLPRIRTGDDDANTKYNIVYNANGKPSEITIQELTPEDETSAKAKKYSFSYDDPANPTRPTEIVVAHVDL